MRLDSEPDQADGLAKGAGQVGAELGATGGADFLFIESTDAGRRGLGAIAGGTFRCVSLFAGSSSAITFVEFSSFNVFLQQLWCSCATIQSFPANGNSSTE